MYILLLLCILNKPYNKKSSDTVQNDVNVGEKFGYDNLCKGMLLKKHMRSIIFKLQHWSNIQRSWI